MKLIYIAGKYRGCDRFEVAINIAKAARVAASVWVVGGVALCPNTNCVGFDGIVPDDVFLKGDLAILKVCHAALFINDWESSVGAKNEYMKAVDFSIPVFKCEQDDQLPKDLIEFLRETDDE